MAYNFLACDRDQPFLLPPDLRDWLPAEHLTWSSFMWSTSSILGRSSRRIERMGMGDLRRGERRNAV